jgi:uncharacterized protein (TIGR00255 family)
MIHSMTGFGKAVKELKEKRVIAEIRSVNSKQFDLSLRVPNIYKEKETELRLWLASRLERGKVDLTLNIEHSAGQSNVTFDKELAALYLNELKAFVEEQKIPQPDYLSAITRMPEVIKASSDTLDEEEWKEIMKCIEEAVQKIIDFRTHEGKILEQDYIMRIGHILEGLSKVAPYEKQRITSIKDRMHKNLSDFMEGEEIDKNRFEQELFYYLEKLDITEEKLRLKKHCDYFLHTLAEDGFHGKKLNFVTQEIGREINTLGSKANDAEIQKIVVGMKDELEKIKEQLLNIL